MSRPRATVLTLLFFLASAQATVGCEAIASIRGLIAVSGEIQEHLENDLKAELTDAKIDKVLAVTPELKAFTETAKVKWKPDPQSADVQQLANALGGLADYMAFFESQGTRITEYYVDIIKMHDARASIMFRRAQTEAKEKLEAEKKALEQKKDSASPEEREQLEREIERATIALQKIEETFVARENARKQGQKQYALGDAEVARVESRLDAINRVFEDAGYVQKGAAQSEPAPDAP
jgi:hypothetical protein